MFADLESKMRNEYKVLTEFLRQYESFQLYLLQASDDEKQTERYKWRETIVRGVEKIYAELNDDLRTILELHHWGRSGRQWELVEVADELFLNTAQINKKNRALLKKFADAIDWAW